MEDKKLKEYIGIREAAVMLHMSYITLRALVFDGKCEIPFVDLGKRNSQHRVIFKRKDVQDYFDSKKMNNTQRIWRYHEK